MATQGYSNIKMKQKACSCKVYIPDPLYSLHKIREKKYKLI